MNVVNSQSQNAKKLHFIADHGTEGEPISFLLQGNSLLFNPTLNNDHDGCSVGLFIFNRIIYHDYCSDHVHNRTRLILLQLTATADPPATATAMSTSTRDRLNVNL